MLKSIDFFKNKCIIEFKVYSLEGLPCGNFGEQICNEVKVEIVYNVLIDREKAEV